MIAGRSTIAVIRKLLLAILVLGLVGTELELLLLEHTEGVWQLTPIALSGAGLIVLIWFGVGRSAAAIQALRVVMVACLLSGAVGVVQHFRGNVVYAQDSNPSLAGRDLYAEAVMGSTPTFAPGTMVELALVGLAFAFRHPRLRGLTDEDATT